MVNILQQAGTPQFAALGCYANACISGVFIINIFILSSKIHVRGKIDPGSSAGVAELYKRKESGRRAAHSLIPRCMQLNRIGLPDLLGVMSSTNRDWGPAQPPL